MGSYSKLPEIKGLKHFLAAVAAEAVPIAALLAYSDFASDLAMAAVVAAG